MTSHIGSMLIDLEIKSIITDTYQFVVDQTHASAAIDDRMLEMSEEILHEAMKAVLKIAMGESYEFEMFELGMQSYEQEFTDAIVSSEVEQLADSVMTVTALSCWNDDKIDNTVVMTIQEIV